MHYLKRTKHHMLTYQKSKSLEIIRYFDFDFARCLHSRDSTLGYIFNHDGGVNILLRGIEAYDITAKLYHWLACCYKY